MADRAQVHRSPEASLLRDVSSGSANLIRTRWVAGVLILLATAFCGRVLALPLPESALYAVGAAVLAYNAVLTWLTWRVRGAGLEPRLTRTRRIVLVQVALDWLSMAAFLHLTGGITSPAIVFLLVHMLIVAILLADRLPYVYVGLGVGVLALIAALEWTGVLVHYTVLPVVPPALHTDPIYVVAQLVFVAVTAFAIVYLTRAIMARLREREYRIVTLLQTTQTVSSTLDPPELLERLARSAAEALAVRGVVICLLDEDSDELTMSAAYGLDQAALNSHPVTLSPSTMESELLVGRPVIVHEVSKDPRVQSAREAAEAGIRSLMAVPIVGQKRSLGVLCAYSDRTHRFTDLDADFAMAIAGQGATALENALTYETLQQSDETRAQFVRMVTHELRAPLGAAQSLLRTVIRGLAGELRPQQHDLLTRVDVRLDMLMALIVDLLALAASRTVGLQEPLKRLPLQPIIKKVVDRLTVEAESKEIELTLDAPFEVLAVLATEEGLTRVLDNLVGNAIKYTPSGGQVCVNVLTLPEGIVIKVSDTGIGIPEDSLPHLWRDFYRAPNARASGIPGTGLGLTIVKQLVDHFGGEISVRSEEGKGTTFRVTLQRAGPADEPGGEA